MEGTMKSKADGDAGSLAYDNQKGNAADYRLRPLSAIASRPSDPPTAMQI